MSEAYDKDWHWTRVLPNQLYSRTMAAKVVFDWGNGPKLDPFGPELNGLFKKNRYVTARELFTWLGFH